MCRNESFMGLVELSYAENTTSWGRTSEVERLSFTVTVTVTADYNVPLRYASASTDKANVSLDSYSCNAKESRSAFLGSPVMPDSGGADGPFSSTTPFTTRPRAGRHSVRVCVAIGGFTLDDEIIFDQQTSGSCNNDGTNVSLGAKQILVTT
ncbi:unnamed protein product [Pylaiella littoralis]